MKQSLFALMALSILACGSPTTAQNNTPPSNVDYKGFVAMASEAESHRSQRLVDIDAFLSLAQKPDTLILDTRSEAAYKRKHFKNAVHLNFSDFTAEKLAKVIPSKSTRVLIYCNNNLEGDDQNFPTKSMPLALNIPTFINLYGYGYKNVYELSSLLSVNDPKLEFEGTAVK